jgi:hypothetical protein
LYNPYRSGDNGNRLPQSPGDRGNLDSDKGSCFAPYQTAIQQLQNFGPAGGQGFGMVFLGQVMTNVFMHQGFNGKFGLASD